MITSTFWFSKTYQEDFYRNKTWHFFLQNPVCTAVATMLFWVLIVWFSWVFFFLFFLVYVLSFFLFLDSANLCFLLLSTAIFSDKYYSSTMFQVPVNLSAILVILFQVFKLAIVLLISCKNLNFFYLAGNILELCNSWIVEIQLYLYAEICVNQF